MFVINVLTGIAILIFLTMIAIMIYLWGFSSGYNKSIEVHKRIAEEGIEELFKEEIF